jgi:hypothetical protein
LSGGCRSFSIRTVDRSLWSMVRRRHHRLRTPPGGDELDYLISCAVRIDVLPVSANGKSEGEQ